MSPDQRAMCFAEWRKCWGAYHALRVGSFPADEKAARVAVTIKAIGQAKSWGGVWQQKEIDRLLAVMFSISASDNLGLQLRQVSQPFTRAEGSEFAQAHLDAIGIEQHGREAYLDGIAKRIHKRPLCDLDDAQWLDVLAALNHTRLHKEGKDHSHPRSPWQGPKSERAARVAARGSRAGQNPASQDKASPTPATGGHTARTGSIVEQRDGEADF